MQITAIALQGMQQAEARLETTAKRLARVADPADNIDLSTEMVALMESRNAFAVNIKALKAANEMQKSVIDLLA